MTNNLAVPSTPLSRPEPNNVDEFKQWSNEGYCHCCRRKSVFVATQSWLRDNYFCSTCQSIPRQRHIQLILDSYFSGWEAKQIHESSPSTGFISQYARNYSSSQYFQDVPPGKLFDGVRCENLEALTFADESFDIFVTQDVLEHVFRPDLAVAEVHRVLKPGGIHIFTAPKHRGLLETCQRAEMTAAGTVNHLLPEMYHGNPVGDGRALVTWDYGYDFEELLSNWSGVSVMTYQTRDRSKGIDALFNEVFVIQKPIGTKSFVASLLQNRFSRK
jgi:SAM-dependent methyltransferase